VEPVDVKQLEDQLAFERKQNAEVEAKYRAAEIEVRDFNATVKRSKDSALEVHKQIVEVEAQLAGLKIRKAKLDEWLNAHPEKPDPASIALVDTATLEAKLREAGAQNVRHEQYLANVKRHEEKQADEKKLLGLEAEQRKLKADKLAKLQGINDSCKVQDLRFDDDGSFTYQGNHAGMLSTSQLIRLSSEIAALYPQNLGLELLDRGESLGRSIFTYVKLAEEKKITVMATIVGDKPADVPENIGVFVVKDGKIFKD
jgi:hypothetical protein